MVIKKGATPKEGEVQSCLLTVVLMANGEVVCLGKTVGWFKELKDCLYTPVINK